MKHNPLDSIRLYKVQDGEQHYLISMGRTRSGAVQAFNGYGTERIARCAGGFGYDKFGVALDRAIERLTGKKSEQGGAAGVWAVIDYWMQAHGVRVVDALEEAIRL